MPGSDALLALSDAAAKPLPPRPRRRIGRAAALGFVLLAVPVLLAVFGPWLTPFDPNGFVGQPYATPDANTLFGTDNLGRDVFSRFLAGGRGLLVLSALATVAGVAAGSIVGTWLALSRGLADTVGMRLADVVLAFPSIVLALMCLSLLGPAPWLIVIVVAMGHFPRTLRVIRSAAMSLVEKDFVKHGETLGFSRLRIVMTALLPNLMVPVMVEFGIRFSYSIGLVASLSFMGIGVQPPNADWGNMINENRIAFTVQPWGVLLPLSAIALLAIGCNIVTDRIGRAASFIEARRSNG